MVRAGAKAVQEEEMTLPFGQVVRWSLELRSGRRKSTVYDLRSYAGRMVRHKDWAEKPLRGIGVEECREMLQDVFGHSDCAFRKGRAILHSLFAFGMRQGWCARNPVDTIDAPQVVEKRIEPLTGAQIARLMAACKEPDMEAAVVLMLWCGARIVPLRGAAAGGERRWRHCTEKLGETLAGAAHASGLAGVAAGCVETYLRQLPPAPFLQPAAAAGGNGASQQRPFAHALPQPEPPQRPIRQPFLDGVTRLAKVGTRRSLHPCMEGKYPAIPYVM